ncbi:MAG: acyltransferase [Bacteroidota bacterium]
MIEQSYKQITSIQALRGLAALWVCYYHLGSTYLPEGHFLRNLSNPGHFGVQLFFVISGFILPYSMHRARFELRQYGRFLARRLLRLEPPYLMSILMIFGLVILSWWSPYTAGKTLVIDWQQFLAHLAYLVPFTDQIWYNPVFWTLGIEFQFYLLIGLAFPLLVDDRLWVRSLVLFSFHLLHYAFPHFYLVFNHALFFIVGMVLFLWWLNMISFREMVTWLVISFAGIFIQWGWAEVLVSLSALLFIYCWQLEWKFLSFLGKISYSLYLIHVPVAVSAFGNFLQNFDYWKNHTTLLAHVALGFAVLAAWIYWGIIEEPFRKWARIIQYKRHETIP